MILPGLCSVTFRQLSAEDIVKLAVQVGLAGIEWGGDVHVPHGDIVRAKEVARLCQDAGLATPSYGSYYRASTAPGAVEFPAVLESAVALGAKTIRIWAGEKESAAMTEEDWKVLTEESLRAADLAQAAGCEIGYEYHLHTATDDNAAVERLLRQVDHPAVKIFWQPRQRLTVEERLESLRAVLPRLAHLHVFQWIGDQNERRPLVEGDSAWKQYLALAESVPGDRFANLEFVEQDSPEVFVRDAAHLAAMLKS